MHHVFLSMPLFEYRCKKCGKVYEELVFGDRDKKVRCPFCGSDNTLKIISLIGGISSKSLSISACGDSCTCAAAGDGCCHHPY
jgi:putative FmdB family regulatory protein